ncbi:N-acetyltransferase DgcN [Flexibacterium corallicola]|uniref:N-acetyltransferase DgcN n=1 Tax=Flexibacterium corallicola TaxID=3037259 RepID=UPI00286EEB8E|nr:N-acetyltransferase DgcN [Pseudovibrio sp. M1P-2-3]
MQIKPPFLLFLGDAQDNLAIKTAQGVVQWRPHWCVGQLRLTGCKADTGFPDITLREAVSKEAKTLVIGCVNAGGFLPDHWIETVVEALDAGLNVASGLHVKLEETPRIEEAAKRNNRQLFNLRHCERTFETGKGEKRRGRRLLTVGTDCSTGKKFTALALEAALRERGHDADFVATGQTGILIAGQGLALDAVVSDFLSGAAEWLTPDACSNHWYIVEGQGSLYHPSFAGVSLGLLHGTQPDAFIVCHEPTRRTMRGVSTPVPTVRQIIDATLLHGKLTNPLIKCIGISVNTENLEEESAQDYLLSLHHELSLPITDPLRYGVEPFIDILTKEFGPT